MRQLIEYYLALWFAPRIGDKALIKLAEDKARLGRFFSADHSLACMGLPDATRQYLQNPPWQEVEKLLAWQASHPLHHIVTLLDEDYPPLLKQSDAPPAVLFVKGNKAALNMPQMAIVGCRAPSRYGEDNAFQFARALSGIGLTITSGLAKGIDTCAHQGALHAGGATIAVLGSGIEQIYPTSNRTLAQKIIDHGALVSELPLHALPDKFNFPKRNRIISALSFGTLIVEAAENSGSLITAQMALNQNRDVFAIPGSIHSPMSRGCHRLIKEGATLVESLADLVLVLQAKLKASLLPLPNTPVQDMDARFAPIWQVMSRDVMPVDLIISQSALDTHIALDLLLQMEVDGLIARHPGGYCKRT